MERFWNFLRTVWATMLSAFRATGRALRALGQTLRSELSLLRRDTLVALRAIGSTLRTEFQLLRADIRRASRAVRNRIGSINMGRLLLRVVQLLVYLVIAIAVALLLVSIGIQVIDLVVIVAVLLVGLYLEWRDWRNRGASRLAEHSPTKLRSIAASYQVRITGKAGNTWDRVFFLGMSAWILPRFFLVMVDWVNIDIPILYLVTMTIGLWALGVIGLLFVSSAAVAKLTYLIVTNYFTGRMHVLVPTFMIHYPWEFYNHGRPVATEAERQQEHSDVLTQRSGEAKVGTKYITTDGVGVTLPNLAIQWGPYLPLAPLNIRYKEGDISGTISEIIDGTLYQDITERTVSDLRRKTTLDAIEEDVIDALQGGNPLQNDRFGNTLEERTGTVFEIATLGAPKFDDDIEQAWRANKVLDEMKDQAKTLMTELKMEGGEALNHVQIVHKENVSKNVVTLEMGDRAKEAIGNLGPVAQAAAGLARALPQGKRGKPRHQPKNPKQGGNP